MCVLVMHDDTGDLLADSVIGNRTGKKCVLW